MSGTTAASTAVREAMKAAGTKLKSNGKINDAFEFLGGGFKNVAKNLGDGQEFMPAIKQAYSKGNVEGGGVAWGAIAGSYMTASAGYRAISGGGAYRDKNGNTNLIGVPFV